jgi:hypothetical protein
MSLRFSVIFLLASTGCAVMHSTQLGDIDADTVMSSKPFEIKLAAIGVDTEEAVETAAIIAEASGGSGDSMRTIGDIIALFQMGPRTGNPVFNVKYSDEVIHQLREECPSGRITGLTMVRETAKYPVVSGEIVKIVGYCQGAN